MTLRRIAIYVLATRFVDMYWNIAPSFENNHSTLNVFTIICSLGAVAGIGSKLLAGSYYSQTIDVWAALVAGSIVAVLLVSIVDLARRLAQSSARRKLILTDAVFSMDGDLAPLPELFELAERYDAWLVVDDAHGFGVLGPGGRGSLAHFGLPPSPRLILMGTLGKAAGVSGAFVAGDRRVMEWLMQRARPYIFTTASSPIIAAALIASLELITNGDERRAHLQRLIARLQAGLSSLAQPLLPSPTAIQPLIIGGNEAAVQLAGQLFERGLWVPAIRPPTVPTGTARLRISLSAAHSEAQLDTLIKTLREYAVNA